MAQGSKFLEKLQRLWGPWTKRFLMACTLCYCVVFIMLMAQVYSDNVVFDDGLLNYPSPPDFSFLYGPDLSAYHFLPDLFLLTLIGWVALSVLILTRGPLRLTLFIRIIWWVSVVYLLRTITLLATTLRNPLNNNSSCITQKRSGAEFFLHVFKLSLYVLGEPATCNDMLFSGHTACSVLMLTTAFSLPFDSKVVRIIYRSFVVTWTVVLWLMIVWTRFHYSVDVVVGIVVAFFVSRTYFFLLTEAMLQASLPSSLPLLDPSHLHQQRLVPFIQKSTIFYRVVLWMDGADITDP